MALEISRPNDAYHFLYQIDTMNQTALDIINKCYETQDTFLDLGMLGLTDEDFVEGSELDLALERCTHVEKITFSDEWLESEINFNKKTFVISCNEGVPNFFKSPPSALKSINKLKTLIMAGASKKWEIGEMEFLEKFTNLVHIDLTNNDIYEIRGLKNCIALKKIYLSLNKIHEINDLKNCISLSELFLSGNKISEIKGIEKCLSLNVLDLSENQIKEMKGLENCSALKSLNLNSNLIAEMKGLENCSALNSLNLDSNQITEIKGLENCTALTILNLNRNRIPVIKGLMNCSELIVMSLSRNRITKIKGLNNCSSLNRLDIEYNQIIKIQGLDNCISLSKLFLNHNQINEIQGLENCSSLSILYLNNNKITEIKGLQTCSDLKLLNLGFNQINEIKGLEQCISIENLFLSENQITEIKGLFKIMNLKGLYLKSNKISTIQNINKLTEIEEIDLSKNPIENLNGLPKLLNFKQLKTLRLFGAKAKDLNIPVELFGSYSSFNCLEPLRGYFASLKKGSFQYNEVPIILVGNSTAGKTSLRYFLSQNMYPPPDNHSTHGIEPDLWVPDDETFENSGVNPKPENLQLYFWDFGGQEYYHATHRLFYSQRAIYILVWEKKTNKQATEEIDIQIKHPDGSIEQTRLPLEFFPYEYWLQGIRYLTQSPDETPVILLQNKIDQPGNEEEPIPDGQMLSNNNCRPFQISISNAYQSGGQGKSDPRTSLLFQQIFKEANNLAMRTNRGGIWSDIKKMLQQIREEKIWTPEQFLEELKVFDENIQENGMVSYLIQLRALGYVFYENQDPLLKNHIFINPGWVTEMIYSILDRSVLENNGEFDKAHVIQKAGEVHSDIFIALMKRFELVFYNEEIEVFIAPQYLPADLLDKRKRNELKAKFDYEQAQPALVLQFKSFMPRYVMLRFMVAFGGQAIGKYYWKNGIAFTVDKCAVLLISDYEARQFRLFVEEEDTHVERLVFNSLVKLIENEKGLSLSVSGSSFVALEKLKEEFPGGKSSGNNNISATDGSRVLLAKFHKLFGDQAHIKPPNIKPSQPKKKIFISYASGGESGKMADDIDTSFALKGIELIRDKRDLGFKGLITEFMKQIGEGEAIVAIISDKYLKSPYCMFELLEIFRNLNFKERIFPIVLTDANIYDPIQKLQYYTFWRELKKQLGAAILEDVDALTVIGDDFKAYKRIFDNYGEVVNVLKDINALNPEMHASENFETLISAIKTQLNIK